MRHEEGNRDPLDEPRIALAAMRAREELADPAVRVHAERYLERADEEIAYAAALAGRTRLVGGDDDRENLALDRAVRAVRLAGAKLDGAIAEERGDRQAEVEATRRAFRIVMHSTKPGTITSSAPTERDDQSG
jgi:hypothetical protein